MLWIIVLSAAFFAFCVFTLYRSLTSGQVPMGWPMPRLTRNEHPIGFWFYVVVYAVGAIIGLTNVVWFLL